MKVAVEETKSEDLILVEEVYDNVETFPSEYNSWEQEFIENIYEQFTLDRTRKLTKRQKAKLEEMIGHE